VAYYLKRINENQGMDEGIAGRITLVLAAPAFPITNLNDHRACRYRHGAG